MRSFIAGRRATMAHEEHDVEAPAVTIRQGIARRVNSQDVAIRQGGALQITGGTVRLSQGGIGIAMAEKATLEQAAAQAVLARDTAVLDQAAAGGGPGRGGPGPPRGGWIPLAHEGRSDGRRGPANTGPAVVVGAGPRLAPGLRRV